MKQHFSHEAASWYILVYLGSLDLLDLLDSSWKINTMARRHVAHSGARCRQGGDPHRPPGALDQVDQRTAAGAAGEPQDTT